MITRRRAVLIGLAALGGAGLARLFGELNETLPLRRRLARLVTKDLANTQAAEDFIQAFLDPMQSEYRNVSDTLLLEFFFRSTTVGTAYETGEEPVFLGLWQPNGTQACLNGLSAAFAPDDHVNT